MQYSKMGQYYHAHPERSHRGHNASVAPREDVWRDGANRNIIPQAPGLYPSIGIRIQVDKEHKIWTSVNKKKGWKETAGDPQIYERIWPTGVLKAKHFLVWSGYTSNIEEWIPPMFGIEPICPPQRISNSPIIKSSRIGTIIGLPHSEAEGGFSITGACVFEGRVIICNTFGVYMRTGGSWELLATFVNTVRGSVYFSATSGEGVFIDYDKVTKTFGLCVITLAKGAKDAAGKSKVTASVAAAIETHVMGERLNFQYSLYYDKDTRVVGTMKTTQFEDKNKKAPIASTKNISFKVEYQTADENVDAIKVAVQKSLPTVNSIAGSGAGAGVMTISSYMFWGSAYEWKMTLVLEPIFMMGYYVGTAAKYIGIPGIHIFPCRVSKYTGYYTRRTRIASGVWPTNIYCREARPPREPRAVRGPARTVRAKRAARDPRAPGTNHPTDSGDPGDAGDLGDLSDLGDLGDVGDLGDLGGGGLIRASREARAFPAAEGEEVAFSRPPRLPRAARPPRAGRPPHTAGEDDAGDPGDEGDLGDLGDLGDPGDPGDIGETVEYKYKHENSVVFSRTPRPTRAADATRVVRVARPPRAARLPELPWDFGDPGDLGDPGDPGDVEDLGDPADTGEARPFRAATMPRAVREPTGIRREIRLPRAAHTIAPMDPGDLGDLGDPGDLGDLGTLGDAGDAGFVGDDDANGDGERIEKSFSLGVGVNLDKDAEPGGVTLLTGSSLMTTLEGRDITSVDLQMPIFHLLEDKSSLVTWEQEYKSQRVYFVLPERGTQTVTGRVGILKQQDSEYLGNTHPSTCEVVVGDTSVTDKEHIQMHVRGGNWDYQAIVKGCISELGAIYIQVASDVKTYEEFESGDYKGERKHSIERKRHIVGVEVTSPPKYIMDYKEQDDTTKEWVVKGTVTSKIKEFLPAIGSETESRISVQVGYLM